MVRHTCDHASLPSGPDAYALNGGYCRGIPKAKRRSPQRTSAPLVLCARASPLARIYELDGFVLLFGVGHARNTSLHLAEYQATFPTKHIVQQGAPISSSGSRRWTTFENIELDSSDFERIGEDYLQSDAGNGVRRGKVGLAECQLMPQRALVDFAVEWLEAHRAK